MPEPRPTQALGLEINECTDGYVIYQNEQDKVHFLNHTAVVVLELCTGQNTAADIAQALAEAYGLETPPLAEVNAALETLVAEGLAG